MYRQSLILKLKYDKWELYHHQPPHYYHAITASQASPQSPPSPQIPHHHEPSSMHICILCCSFLMMLKPAQISRCQINISIYL